LTRASQSLTIPAVQDQITKTGRGSTQKFCLGFRDRSAGLALLLIVLLGFASRSANATSTVADGSDIRVSVITMGPGDAGWEKFGHIALRIQDPQGLLPQYPQVHDVMFNWGIFNFKQKNFYLNFLQGRMIYMTAAEDGPLSLQDYHDSGRAVYEQVLHLTGAQKIELERRCAVAIDEEHRNYRYDYYRDNCSTRVRDILDDTLRGQIKQQTESKPSGVTLRWHTRRLLTDDLPLYVALQAELGHPVDQPISQWQEMFLPSKLRERLREIMVVQTDGSKAPLLEYEQIISAGDKPPEALGPPRSVPYALLSGTLLGGAFVGLTLLIVWKKRLARTGLIVLGLGWLLLIGIGGVIGAWAWIGTDHFVAKYNENLLQVTPLGLVLAILLPKASGGGKWLAFIISAIIAGLSVLGLALKVTPFFFQVNGDMIALCLPVHLALCWSLWRLSKLPPRIKAEEDVPAGKKKSRKRAALSRSSRSPRAAAE
jgi:uncharacterized protein DUF4105